MTGESNAFARWLRVLRTIAAGLFLMTGAAFSETNEMPKYSVVSSEGAIEVRDYPTMIVAEVTVEGVRAPAISQGFTMLAEFIFGANMPGEKIAMTAPVTQQSGQGGSWNVQFMMPSQYTLASLPKPKNDKIKLREMVSARYATIRFSGNANDEKLVASQETALRAFMDKNNLKSTAAPVYAFYDPPWVPPAQRRNEIHIEVSK